MATSLHRLVLPLLVGVGLALAISSALKTPIDLSGLGVCLTGIWTAYALDTLLDQGWKGASGLEILQTGVPFLLMVGLVVLHPQHLFSLALLAFMGTSYIFLKTLLSKNILTASAWTITLFVLPFSGLAFSFKLVSLVVAIFSILISNTILTDIHDIDQDRQGQVKSIATRFGKTDAIKIAAAFALIGAIAAGCALCYPLIAVGVIYAAPALGDKFRRTSLYTKSGVDLVLAFGGLIAFFTG